MAKTKYTEGPEDSERSPPMTRSFWRGNNTDVPPYPVLTHGREDSERTPLTWRSPPGWEQTDPVSSPDDSKLTFQSVKKALDLESRGMMASEWSDAEQKRYLEDDTVPTAPNWDAGWYYPAPEKKVVPRTHRPPLIPTSPSGRGSSITSMLPKDAKGLNKLLSTIGDISKNEPMIRFITGLVFMYLCYNNAMKIRLWMLKSTTYVTGHGDTLPKWVTLGVWVDKLIPGQGAFDLWGATGQIESVDSAIKSYVGKLEKWGAETKAAMDYAENVSEPVQPVTLSWEEFIGNADTDHWSETQMRFAREAYENYLVEQNTKLALYKRTHEHWVEKTTLPPKPIPPPVLRVSFDEQILYATLGFMVGYYFPEFVPQMVNAVGRVMQGIGESIPF